MMLQRLKERLKNNRRIGWYIMLVGIFLLIFNVFNQRGRDVVIHVVLSDLARGRLGECNRESISNLDLRIFDADEEVALSRFTFDLGAPVSVALPAQLAPGEYVLRGSFSCGSITGKQVFFARGALELKEGTNIVVHLH